MEKNINNMANESSESSQSSELSSSSITPNTAPIFKKVPYWKSPFLYLSIFLGILLIGLLIFIFSNNKSNQTNNIATTIASSTPTQASTNVPQTSVVNTTTNVISTTAMIILPNYIQLSDLHLFKNGPDYPSPDYYQAGTFISGKYAGYKRIISINSPFYYGGDGTFTDVFATKDNKTYVAQFLYNAQVTSDKKTIDSDNLNSNLVVMEDDLLTFSPLSISLDSSYSLVRQPNTVSLALVESSTGEKDSYGNTITKYVPIKDFSKYVLLGSDNNYSYYQNQLDIKSSNDSTRQKYLQGDTHIFAIDKSGFVLSYNLVFTRYVQPYLDSLNKNSQNQYLNFPSLSFKNSDVSGNNNIYINYDHPFPGVCGGNLTYFVAQNITDSDLLKIGDINNSNVYTLKDKNHPLNQLEYKKISAYKDGLYNTLGTPIPKSSVPTYEQYVAKNPILLLKDNWGRFIVTGEYDYILPGGCGKPVLYLYPTIDTSVSVKFSTPMKFNTTIPTYNNGWNVLAHSNGTLTDLQPQYTNCDSFENKFGSEYAKQSCVNNKYPYLYWAGDTNNSLPLKINLGWIVNKDNLNNFLNDKLTSIGLNSKEKEDMLSYWIPQMELKNTPYYKISFLQTTDMNIIAPMNISPTPDTLFRIFLNWEPLDIKPSEELRPQSLNQIKRSGFTVVEWGGLKR